MGTVYTGVDDATGRPVTLTVLHPILLPDARLVTQCREVARSLSLVAVPEIARLLDAGQLPDGRVYLVTEPAEGETLAARLKRGGSLPQAESVALARSLAMALFSAHQKGIVHLNLRPESVVFTRAQSPSQSLGGNTGGEQLKLLDLGVFKALGQKGRAVLLRAPTYLAPEQAVEGGLVNRQADVYALGALLYELLAGRPPFTGTRDVLLLAHRSTAPMPLSQAAPSVHPELSALVTQMLAKAAGDRPGMADVHQKLTQIEEALLIGQNVGSYRVVGRLSQGGMGTVFEAIHEQIGRRAAIKVMRQQFAGAAEFNKRFLNEARAVNIVRHPGLVEVYEFGQLKNGNPFIIMEYLEGVSLTARLKARNGRLSESEAVSLVRQIAMALAAAHGKGIVHRDLKPDNVMIIPDPVAPEGERVKLFDFGIAKMAKVEGPADADATQLNTHIGTLMGTPLYMAPEQFLGASGVDGKADVYSLGVMLYEMLAGRRPYQQVGPMMEPPPPLKTIATEVSPATAALCDGMLALAPSERPRMAEVAALLEPPLSGLLLEEDPAPEDLSPRPVMAALAAAGKSGQRPLPGVTSSRPPRGSVSQAHPQTKATSGPVLSAPAAPRAPIAGVPSAPQATATATGVRAPELPSLGAGTHVNKPTFIDRGAPGSLSARLRPPTAPSAGSAAPPIPPAALHPSRSTQTGGGATTGTAPSTVTAMGQIVLGQGQSTEGNSPATTTLPGLGGKQPRSSISLGVPASASSIGPSGASGATASPASASSISPATGARSGRAVPRSAVPVPPSGRTDITPLPPPPGMQPMQSQKSLAGLPPAQVMPEVPSQRSDSVSPVYPSRVEQQAMAGAPRLKNPQGSTPLPPLPQPAARSQPALLPSQRSPESLSPVYPSRISRELPRGGSQGPVPSEKSQTPTPAAQVLSEAAGRAEEKNKDKGRPQSERRPSREQPAVGRDSRSGERPRAVVEPRGVQVPKEIRQLYDNAPAGARNTPSAMPAVQPRYRKTVNVRQIGGSSAWSAALPWAVAMVVAVVVGGGLWLGQQHARRSQGASGTPDPQPQSGTAATNPGGVSVAVNTPPAKPPTTDTPPAPATAPPAAAAVPIDVQATRTQALAVLQAGVRDPDVALRLAALNSLAQSRDPRQRALIEPLLKDKDTALQARAAEALGQLNAIGAGPALVKLVEETLDPFTFVAAAAALDRLGNPLGLKRLREAMQAKDTAVRLKAALLLDGRGDAEARRFLSRYLSSPETTAELKVTLLDRLAVAGDASARARLSELRTSTPRPEIKIAATEKLVRLGDEPARAALEQAAAQAGPEQLLAARALLSSGDPRGCDLFRATVADSSAPLPGRLLAVSGLGACGKSEDVRVLEKLLSEGELKLRLQAAGAVLVLSGPRTDTMRD